MSRLLEARGVFSISKPSREGDPLEVISDALSSARAHSIERDGHKLRFSAGPLRFVPSWNPLLQIDRGEIEVMKRNGTLEIRYRLRFWQLLALTGFLSGGAALMTFRRLGWHSIGLFALFFALSFGLNRLIGPWQFRELLRKSFAASSRRLRV